MMLRVLFFTGVMVGGTVILKTFEILPRDEAWLVSAVIGAILMFAIPEQNKKRDPKFALLMLIVIVGVYAICFKLFAWLT